MAIYTEQLKNVQRIIVHHIRKKKVTEYAPSNSSEQFLGIGFKHENLPQIAAIHTVHKRKSPMTPTQATSQLLPPLDPPVRQFREPPVEPPLLSPAQYPVQPLMQPPLQPSLQPQVESLVEPPLQSTLQRPLNALSDMVKTADPPRDTYYLPKILRSTLSSNIVENGSDQISGSSYPRKSIKRHTPSKDSFALESQMSVSALHQLMRYEMPPALSHFNETTYMTRRRYYESYHQNHPSKILPKSQIWYPLYPRQDGIPLSQFHGIHDSTASLSPTRNTQYTQRVYPIFQNTRGLPSSYQQPQNEVLELQNQTELAAKQSRQSIDPKLLAIPPADRTMKSPSSELPLLSFQRTTDPANIFQEQSRYDWNELQFHLPPVVPDVPADVFCRDILKEKEKSHQDMLLNYVSNLESPQHSESEKDVNNNCCDPLPLFKESSEIQDKYNDANNAVISHLSHFRPPQSEHTNRGIDHNFCSTACHSEASQIRDPYKDASHTVFNTLSLFRSPQTVDTNRSVDHSFCNIGSPPFRDMRKDANNAVFSHRSHFRLPQTEGTNIGIDQSFCTTASHNEASQMRDIHMDAIRLFCDERLDFDSPQIEDTNKDANDNICNRFSKFESLPIQDSCKDVNSKVCVKKETLSPCDSSIVADKEVFNLTRVKVEKIEDKHFTDNCNQYGNFDSTSRLFLDETSQQRSQMSMMKNTGPLATESMTTNIKLEPEDEVHLKSETDVCLIVGAATVTNNIFDKFVSELNKT